MRIICGLIHLFLLFSSDAVMAQTNTHINTSDVASISISVPVLGEAEITEIMDQLFSRANGHMIKQEYEKALPLWEELLIIHDSLYPNHFHIRIAAVYGLMGDCYRRLGNYENNLKCKLKALQICEELYPEGHPANADFAEEVGTALSLMNRHSDALEYYKKAMEMYQRLYPEGHPEMAACYSRRMMTNISLGQFDDALHNAQLALEMNSRLYKGDHSEIAVSFSDIAAVLMASNRSLEAIPYLKKSLEMRLRLSPGDQDEDDLALCYFQYVSVLSMTGHFANAIPYCEEAISEYQKLNGRYYREVAHIYMYWSACLLICGRRDEGLEKIQDATEFYEKVPEPVDFESLNIYSFAGSYYRLMHQPEKAMEFLDKELDIWIRLYPDKNHIRIAACYWTKATLLMSLERKSEALECNHKALAILEYPNLEDTMVPEGSLFSNISDSMLRFHRKYLKYSIQATINDDRQDYDKAATCYEKALESLVNQYPDRDNLELSHTYYFSGRCNFLLGRYGKAIEMWKEAVLVSWNALNLNFPFCSEDEQIKLISELDLKGQQNRVLNLVFQAARTDDSIPKSEYNAIGFLTVLLTKNVLLDIRLNEQAVLNHIIPFELNEEYQEYLLWRQQYSALGLQFSDLMLSGGQVGIAADIPKDLRKKIDDREKYFRSHIPDYARLARLKEISIEDVHRALKPGQILLEYIKFQPFIDEPNSIAYMEQSHYAVFIVDGGKKEITAYDLGPADILEDLLRRYQTALAEQITDLNKSYNGGPDRNDEIQLAEIASDIRNLILPADTVLCCLNTASRLYIAPAGELLQFPFESIPQAGSDEPNYLINRYEIVYLNTARDFVRLYLTAENSIDSPKGDAPPKACIIVNPDYNLHQSEVRRISQALRSSSPIHRTYTSERVFVAAADSLDQTMGLPNRLLPEISCEWPPLRYTQRIVNSFGKLLEEKGYTVDPNCFGSTAVEEAFYTGSDCQIITFATHGHYWENAPEGTNPLVRSMLVLAGANTRNSDGYPGDINQINIHDGLLTAYEISGTNLRHTEFVNLIGCETGLGTASDYQGLIGLRSSFILAGARSIGMSLWKVNLWSTVDQMEKFYKFLFPENGTSPYRYGAFRKAQLEALGRNSHPWFWAGFIYIGDPGDMKTANNP